MGGFWSAPTPSPPSSASPKGTQQAISPAGAVGQLRRAKRGGSSGRMGTHASPSSTSATRATALLRARLKRRRRRMKKKGMAKVARVVTVDGVSEAADKGAAAEVMRQIVGQRVLLYWPSISAWVECEVLEYGGERGVVGGQHRVQYVDGLCEWRVLKQYRLVIGAKVFARAIRGKQDGMRSEAGAVKIES